MEAFSWLLSMYLMELCRRSQTAALPWLSSPLNVIDAPMPRLELPIGTTIGITYFANTSLNYFFATFKLGLAK